MAAFIPSLLCALAILSTIPTAVSGVYCYDTYISGYTYYYCYNYYEIPVGTIIGAVVGGIAGLIVLCGVSVVICVVCCKRKPTPGTIIHPAGVTAITSASNNAYTNYSQQQQGWGAQPSAPYPGQQQPYPPQPQSSSQPMPPPTYAENVINGPPPQHTK